MIQSDRNTRVVATTTAPSTMHTSCGRWPGGIRPSAAGRAGCFQTPMPAVIAAAGCQAIADIQHGEPSTDTIRAHGLSARRKTCPLRYTVYHAILILLLRARSMSCASLNLFRSLLILSHCMSSLYLKKRNSAVMSSVCPSSCSMLQ